MLALALLPLIDGGFDNNVIYWVIIAIAGVALLISPLQGKEGKSIAVDTPLLFYILLLCLSLISMIWSINKVRTLIEFLQLVCYGMVYVIVRNLDEDNKYRVGRIAYIVGAAIAILSISEYIFVNSTRMQGTFTNPNPFGIYTAIVFLLGWGYYLRSPNRALGIASMVLLVTLILTGSRGSFLSTFIALPFLFMNLRGKQLKASIIKTILFILIAIVLTQGIMLAAPYIQENLDLNITLSKTLRIGSMPGSITGRLEFWKVAGRLILRKPVTGFGLGTFFSAYYIEYAGNQWYSRFVHNHYLQTAVELGLLGIGMLSAFLISSGLKIKKKFTKGTVEAFFPGALAGVVAFLLHIGIDFSWNFPGVTVLFFALLGAITGGHQDTGKHTLKLNRKAQVGALAFVILLTLWQVSSQAMYVKGLNLANEGNLEESNRIYEITNTYYPINSVGYSLASSNYQRIYETNKEEESLDKAIQLAKQAVKLAPIDGKFHNQLGNLHFLKGNIADTEHHLQLGVEYGAYALGRYVDLGAFYMAQGNMKDAEIILARGLDLKQYSLMGISKDEKYGVIDEVAQLHLLLANIYQRSGSENKAESHIKEIIELKEEYPFLEKYFTR
jgi:O-antigen ligase